MQKNPQQGTYNLQLLFRSIYQHCMFQYSTFTDANQLSCIIMRKHPFTLYFELNFLNEPNVTEYTRF